MFSFFLIDQFNTNDFTRQFFNLDISENVTVDKVFVLIIIIQKTNKNYVNYNNQIVIYYKNNNYCNKFYYKKQLVTQKNVVGLFDFIMKYLEDQAEVV